MPIEIFHQAVLAFAAGDYQKAQQYAQQAAQLDPNHPVYPAAVTYLARVTRAGKANVYVSGEGFAAFIRGGGNLGLYAATSAALAQAYAEQAQINLLDIGVGDGLALLPALGPSIAMIDLVEPSAAMLDQTISALSQRGLAHRSFLGTLQAFAAAEQASRHWDIAQATFSMQSLPPAERRAALSWLHGAVDRLLIVEFDVPDLFGTPLSLACVAHVLARYRLGLAEYPASETVIQGFLMPVMFGYFDPGTARTNYEQPIAAWRDDLAAAGFSRVTARPIFSYWWADAYLIEA
jgi:tetratricopeptide (TPR) repeat protein